jgi:hypothetical protein
MAHVEVTDDLVFNIFEIFNLEAQAEDRSTISLHYTVYTHIFTTQKGRNRRNRIK